MTLPNTQGLRQDSNPSMSAPGYTQPRGSQRSSQARVLEVDGAVRGWGWRPGEVTAPSPSRCCCCCRRGGGWGTLCAMGVMAAVGYMAAETGSGGGREVGGRRSGWGGTKT